MAYGKRSSGHFTFKDVETRRRMEGDDIQELSEQGVRFIVLSALTDPENVAQIRTLEEPKKSKDHLQRND